MTPFPIRYKAYAACAKATPIRNGEIPLKIPGSGSCKVSTGK